MNHKNKVISIISALSVVPENEIALEDDFAEIGIDSLKKVELIITIEDELDIKFDDGELDPNKLITVKNILELAGKYVATGA
ncbi:MAG: acyl carrier protein [Oscillospiraceae bacterium]|nr:acyl carrier protein [Oscillospiraceae bacterium]